MKDCFWSEDLKYTNGDPEFAVFTEWLENL